MDGDGGVSSSNATNCANTFLSRAADMGCPTNSQDDDNDCTGCELAENPDFNSNDAYSNWTPIGRTFAAAPENPDFDKDAVCPYPPYPLNSGGSMLGMVSSIG